MAVIKAFRDEPEDLEVFWLVGFRMNPEIGWQVGVVTRGCATMQEKLWWLPIGSLPLLAPGRCFIKGAVGRIHARGIIERIKIDNLVNGIEVSSSHVPSNLYSFGAHSGGVQKLRSYSANGRECLIPTIELVRYLFLHNKTMANTLMRQGGLMELFSQTQLGYHDDLHLWFTAKMPLVCLSDAFAAEFAWLAVNAEGRRSWDSVYELSSGQRYVSFSPPPLKNSVLTARVAQNSEAALVLEILHLTGKEHTCDRLSYSHPSMRKPSGDDDDLSHEREEDNERTPSATDDADAEDECVRQYVLDDSATGSRTNVNQAALHAPGKWSSFETEIPIEREPEGKSRRRRREKVVEAGEQRDQTGTDIKTVIDVPLALNEEELVSSVSPIELRLLEPVGPDYFGSLEPLIKAIGLIAKKRLPVEISTALCSLKGARKFSRAEPHRRICFIAVFTFHDGVRYVLLDVDHSGLDALSALTMKYHRPTPIRTIEEHVKLLLDGLVDNGGRWKPDVITESEDGPICARLPNVMRRRPEEGGKSNSSEDAQDKEYLIRWANRLVRRLELRGKQEAALARRAAKEGT